uniref:Uncharacterized protein n=1 Tax=Lotharella globosa TaxID=91324 RepID=A0A6V3JT55_9EUKA
MTYKSRGLILLCLVALPLCFAALVAGLSLAARAKLKATTASIVTPRTKMALPLRAKSMYLPGAKPKTAASSAFASDVTKQKRQNTPPPIFPAPILFRWGLFGMDVVQHHSFFACIFVCCLLRL